MYYCRSLEITVKTYWESYNWKRQTCKVKLRNNFWASTRFVWCSKKCTTRCWNTGNNPPIPALWNIHWPLNRIQHHFTPVMFNPSLSVCGNCIKVCLFYTVEVWCLSWCADVVSGTPAAVASCPFYPVVLSLGCSTHCWIVSNVHRSVPLYGLPACLNHLKLSMCVSVCPTADDAKRLNNSVLKCKHYYYVLRYGWKCICFCPVSFKSLMFVCVSWANV